MRQILVFLMILTAAWSCRYHEIRSGQKTSTADTGYVRKPSNAIYYWKTTFSLSDGDRKFIADHHIGRVYIRYFDVYMDPDTYRSPAPEATIRFRDPVPDSVEVIPTVFIDNELFRYCDMPAYAKRITDRIRIMSETNDIKGIREIQLDCDWTKGTEAAYFDFLKKIKEELSPYGIILSATIRLHQLNMAVPPADRGVLMCYNTGAVRSSDTRNSILNASDVSLYAQNLKSYQLPLDLAYPTFSWAVLFSNDRFRALLRTADPQNGNLTHLDENRYVVNTGFYQEGKYLAPGDEIRFEFSDFQEIAGSKKLLEHQLDNYSIILYHLDQTNLSKYSYHEITEIYNN